MKTILIKMMVISLMVFAGGLALIKPVVATDTCDKNNLSLKGGVNCAVEENNKKSLFDGNDSLFKKITNTLLFLIGAVSVVMIIYAGIQYATSGGDSGKVTSAKNTILYAVVGIVVAILAYAIVNFVVEGFTKSS